MGLGIVYPHDPLPPPFSRPHASLYAKNHNEANATTDALIALFKLASEAHHPLSTKSGVIINEWEY
jgi:hypothetical protein